MIVVKNIQTIDNERTTLEIPSKENEIIEAEHLTLFPGLIDPHVHFRTPGHEYKEDWYHAAMASIFGGYTTVFDMPNTVPACITRKRLHEKKQLINHQLEESGVPLHYQLYFGADKNNFDSIYQIKDEVIGIKVFMGSSTGDLLMDDDSSLHAIFAIAAKHNLLVAVHAEDEEMIQKRKSEFQTMHEHCIHSKIRTPEVAAKAVEKAIFLSEMYGTRCYILHVSSQAELELIQKAKQKKIPIFAETTPHHLFLDDSAYEALGAKAQMNPPLRSASDRKALWNAIHNNVIDTIGSDHAPHTLEEKNKPYGKSPSGVPGIETTLPLLLNAYHQNQISLHEIVSLTHDRILKMFPIKHHNDYVLVDLEKEKEVVDTQLQTKCQWSPFSGRTLKGWPAYTIIGERVFNLLNKVSVSSSFS